MPTKRPNRPFPVSGTVDQLFTVCCESFICDKIRLRRWRANLNSRKVFTVTFVVLMLLVDSTVACGPGRGGGRRRSPRKLTPLVFKQHVPNVSENTLGASGLNEGKISREDQRFRELVPNYNPDIIFKDEEGTGADRLMTPRLKEKLNTLAISVMNQWPGVRLRVTEGWDEQENHAVHSLHYEGRAVDITTSDKDRSKYGMLARLAVEAGFDWVYYESRFHIHVSVKSEKSDAGRSGGCFDGSSLVQTKRGVVRVDQLQIGDNVLSVDSNNRVVFSEVVLFLDRQPDVSRLYYTFETENGKTISLTESHLLFVADNGNATDRDLFAPMFARDIRIGQYVYTSIDKSVLKTEKIVNVKNGVKRGVFAPLTSEGTILVNQVLASCYAVIDDQQLAHFSFLPIRLWTNFVHSLQRVGEKVHINFRSKPTRVTVGVHWYPKFLYSIAKRVLPFDRLF